MAKGKGKGKVKKNKKKAINFPSEKPENTIRTEFHGAQILLDLELQMQLHRTLVQNMPADRLTNWYVNQEAIANREEALGLPTTTFNLPKNFAYTLFAPIIQPENNRLTLYCHLLTALTEAIVENACKQGTINDLDEELMRCLNALHATAPDKDYLGKTTALADRLLGTTDILVRERMCTLWISLFLCTSEAYSQYVCAYFDLYDDSTSTWYHDAIRSVYDVPSAMRDFIRQTLKPFFRPEWLEEPSVATATKHMANYLHYMIQRVYDAACLMQGEDLEDHIRSVPTALFRELDKALESGNYAVLRRFSDPGADRTACLFGVYHLACQKTLWMSSLLGSTFLTAQLYHTPLRYRIQQLYTKKTVDEAQFARFRPAFSLFDLPQPSDSSAPSDTEQARMQQLLFFLGLRFYDREQTESVRAQAESLFRDCLTVYEPTSDLEAGAIAATSFLSLQMQSGSVYRIAAVKALSESTVDQMYLQRSHDSLQQKADRQQTYADELTRANAVLERENQKLQQQIADLQADKMDLQRQVHDLLDLFDTEDGEEADQTPISFPAELSPCTALLYGGTPGFQTELRRLLPDLRVMEDSKRIDKSALGKADIVFIAVTHFGHSRFDSIMNFCRPNQITTKPIHSTSAKGAAVRIVKEVQILQSKQALDKAQQSSIQRR